jgi:hypothetical protein
MAVSFVKFKKILGCNKLQDSFLSNILTFLLHLFTNNFLLEFERLLLLLFIYLFLNAIVLTPGGSTTAHIYTQTEHRIHRTQHT